MMIVNVLFIKKVILYRKSTATIIEVIFQTMFCRLGTPGPQKQVIPAFCYCLRIISFLRRNLQQGFKENYKAI